MKKLLCAVVLLGISAGAAPLFAQTISPKNASEYYYVNMTLEKIYPYRAGYVLQYRKGMNGRARTYIPNEWFTDAGSKAELINLPPGKNWPSLTVYYKNGEFSHVRLYIHRSRAHQTWGSIPQTVNIDEFFTGVEEVKFEY